MLGGGVSAAVKTPSFEHTPAIPYYKATVGTTFFSVFHPVFDS